MWNLWETVFGDPWESVCETPQKTSKDYKTSATEWVNLRAETAVEHLYVQIKALLKHYNCGGRWNLETFKVDVATERGKKMERMDV